MSEVVWIRVSPRNPATGEPVELLLAGGGQDMPYRHPADGRQYRAGIVRRPLYAAQLGFGARGWTGNTRPLTSSVSFSTADQALRDQLASFVWASAPIVVETGAEGTAPAAELVGKVEDAEFSRAGITFTILDLTEGLEAPIARERFGGTGGIEGPEEATGRVKRRSFGKVFNVEGRLLDAANSIYEFGDPKFPFSAWSALRDKGREGPFALLSWQGSVGATFAALQASEPERGGGVAAPSIACAKWWTQPAGPLTADFTGTPGTGGSIAAPALADAICQLGDGPSVAELAGAIALRPGDAGLHIGSDRESFAQAIDRLLLGVSLLWLPRPDGSIAIRPWAFDEAAELLQSEFKGRARTYPPHGRRRVGYRRNERIHNEGEIAEALELASTVVGLLSNPSHQVQVDPDGDLITHLAARSGKFFIHFGNNEISASGNVAFSVHSQEGGTFSIDATGVYSLETLAAETASAILRAEVLYDGQTVTVDREFRITRIPVGRYLAMASIQNAAVSYNAAGEPEPASQTISFNLYCKDISSADLTWEMFKIDAAGAQTPVAWTPKLTGPYLRPPNGEMIYYYLSGAEFAAITGDTHLGIRVRASVLVDGITYEDDGFAWRTQDGKPGDSVTMIYRRSAAQPATPAPSAETPEGWYPAVADVPASDDPMWSSVGSRAGGQAIAVYQTPVLIEGTQGVPGPPGEDGQATYVWVAYADSADGTVGFITGANDGRSYIGIAPNKATPTESTDPAQYTWSLIKGDQGVPGPPGDDGQPTYVWFAYANNASGTSGFTTGGWSGQTYIGIATNKGTPTESANPADYSWSLIKGEKGDQGDRGDQGVPGPPGDDGQPTYVWIAYADNSSGTLNFSRASWSGQAYLGIAANKSTSSESSNPSDYTWSKIEGPQGPEGPPGEDGQDAGGGGSGSASFFVSSSSGGDVTQFTCGPGTVSVTATFNDGSCSSPTGGAIQMNIQRGDGGTEADSVTLPGDSQFVSGTMSDSDVADGSEVWKVTISAVRFGSSGSSSASGRIEWTTS